MEHGVDPGCVRVRCHGHGRDDSLLEPRFHAVGSGLDSIAVAQLSPGTPPATAFALGAMSPDPVVAGGRMIFQLARPGRATLTICDVQGRSLLLLADGTFGAGAHEVGLSPHAIGARPGLYFAFLRAAGRTLVQRFTILP